MAHFPQGGEFPPPYHNADARGDPDDELLRPVILVLAANLVYAQASGGPPLFELSRGVAESPDSGSPISLKRLTHSVRTTARGLPRAAQRSRVLFELKHLGPVLSKGFPYCLDAASRAAIGNLALKAVSFPRRGFKVVRTEPVTDDDGLPKGYKARRRSLKEAEVIFEVSPKERHYEWIDADGKRIAAEDETDGQHRLIVTASLTRKTMDALVASWCLRIWHDNLESNHEAGSWKGRKLFFFFSFFFFYLSPCSTHR
ncbi:hypothetical protein F5X96DRAFT_636098 [Biscogniauxia mediterranea]|nr:hypothetical protein F5X96DRAFT_636098 [Biscogniauxia mediterranea]